MDAAELAPLGIVDFAYTEEVRPHSFDRYHVWVKQGKHRPLEYLADHRRDKRQSLKKYFPRCKSALIFLFSYARQRENLKTFYQSGESNGLKMASYLFGFEGRDYHQVVGERLAVVEEHLRWHYPQIETRPCLDVHPVLERDLAFRAGLGWFGKNSMLLSRRHGSFFILGSLLLSQTLPLEVRALEADHCGQCSACVEACPTGAIDPESRTLNASRCLSTFTIELFAGNEAPPPHRFPNGGEIYGCDICQDVCPWTQHVAQSVPVAQGGELKAPLLQKLMAFFLKRPLSEIILELEKWSNKRFAREFKETPLARTGRKGLLRNLRFQASSGQSERSENL